MKKQLIKSLIMLLLCMTTMVTGTYAWLASNRLVSAKNIDMELAYNGAVIINIEVYKYNQEENTVEKFKFTDFPEMTSFDSIFKERNVNTPLVFKITLLGEFANSESMDLKLVCSSNVASREARKTSNLIYVKAASKETIFGTDEEETENEDISEVFHTVVQYFQNISLKKEFLEVQENTEGEENWTFVKKNTSITYPFLLTETEKSAESKLVDVFMIMDYSERLVDAHELTKYGQIEIMGENAIRFSNDFTKLMLNVNYRDQ